MSNQKTCSVVAEQNLKQKNYNMFNQDSSDILQVQLEERLKTYIGLPNIDTVQNSIAAELTEIIIEDLKKQDII